MSKNTCGGHGCDALVTGDDMGLLKAVPEERTVLAHIGPVNWDKKRDYVRFLYSDSETDQHHVMVLAALCATKLICSLLMALGPKQADAAINHYRKRRAEGN